MVQELRLCIAIHSFPTINLQAALGNWTPANAIPLSSATYPIWRGTVSLRHFLSLGDLGHNNQASSLDGGYRAFTDVTAIGTLSDYVSGIDGGMLATSTLHQRGTSLTESSAAGGAYSIATTASSIGSNQNQALGVTGRFSTCIALNALPSAGALTALLNFGATLRTLAGV